MLKKLRRRLLGDEPTTSLSEPTNTARTPYDRLVYLAVALTPLICQVLDSVAKVIHG